MGVLSRLHWLIPVEPKFLRHVKPHLEKLFIEHGPLKHLQSDRGKEFKKEVKEVTWNEFFCLTGALSSFVKFGRKFSYGTKHRCTKISSPWKTSSY